MKLNIELYVKVDFLGTGVSFSSTKRHYIKCTYLYLYKRPITGTGKETHMDIPVF